MRMHFAVGVVLLAAGLARVPALAHHPSVSPLAGNKVVALGSTVLITNTGSTNTTGYSVALDPAGRAKYRTVGGADVPGKLQVGHVPGSVARKFYRDLSAAMPLANLLVRHGPKSASFGTFTYIDYKGQRTPDLSSPADAKGLALQADVAAITAALRLKNGPRRPVQPGIPSIRAY